MRYFILALFAAFLVAVPAAGAKAVKVSPTYSITAAAVSGKNVKFTIAVTVTGVPKCSGKVTATHKISKKKSVSWSARYTGDSAICTAAIKGKLPKASFGKKVKFAIKFPGNDAIKKFSASKSLTLTPPAPPPAPAPSPPGGGSTTPIIFGPQSPGLWTVTDVSDGSSGFTYTLREDRTVPGMASADGIGMNCSVLGTNTHVPTYWNNQNFGMGGAFGSVGSDGAGNQVPNMSYSLYWTFTDANTGTGNFSASGTYQPGGTGTTTYSCQTTFNVVYSRIG
jgi:hypothetical protein